VDDVFSRVDSLDEKEAEHQSVVVNVNTLGPSKLLSDYQVNADLRNGDWEFLDELLRDLNARNVGFVSLRARVLGKRTVLEDLSQLRDKSQFEYCAAIREKHRNAQACVFLWLPGYSRDKSQAVVRFTFGPTPHGATATYLLQKEEGKWKIRNFRIAYYA
jgi:hypothetical protein